MFVSFNPTIARGGDFSGTVEAGFDSFTEQYTIVEEDTLDQLNEFQSRLSLRYLMGGLLKTHFLAEGRSMVGGQSVEYMGRLAFLYRGQQNRIFAEGFATSREYHEGTEYSFPNDFLRYNARVYFQRQINSALSLRLADRIEYIDFDQRTEFDYDYYLNRLILSANLDTGIASSHQAAIGYSHKEIPDSTEIEYDSLTGAVEFRLVTGLHRQVFVSVTGERRVYNNEPTRSPFWSMLVLANIHPITFSNFAAGVDLAGEAYNYDHNTTAYFDYVETRAFAFASYFRGFNLTVRLGPVAGFLLSGESQQDEYYELGGRVAIDYFSTDRIWLSASYEPGHRNYLFTAESELEQIFSDFTYHSVSLITTIQILPQTNFNLFVDYEPQDHAIRSDDSMSALFSANISYHF